MWPLRKRYVLLKVIVGVALTVGIFNLVAFNWILFKQYVNEQKQSVQQEKIIRKKLEQLQTAIKSVHRSQGSLLEQVENISAGMSSDESDENLMENNRSMEWRNTDLCTSAFGVSKTLGEESVNTLKVLESLTENLTMETLSKQPSWNIKVDQKRFRSSANKLRVFLVPFSVNNPALTQTLEINFARYTRNILKHVLMNLRSNPSMKFVWLEVFMFRTWWRQLHPTHKREIREVIANGQLEFVSGGWVTTDQSSTHYYSLLTQLIEGRQYLYQHFNVTPNNGMELYGMSPTMAYLLKRAGTRNSFGGVVIQNAHNMLKMHLAEKQLLEFNFGQNWGEVNILCHLMPFSSYDQIHTCGPDSNICYNFDFKQMFRKNGIKASKPLPISKNNVKQSAELLLEQFHKKAMLFKTNNLLIPLGGDFAWENQREWDAQIDNYKELISYVNSVPELNAHIQFATLNDYFNALNRKVSMDPSVRNTLIGDMFPDHDHPNHQMDYSSRPFLKEMERDLVSNLRSAQIMFAQVCAEISKRFDKKVVETSPYISRLLGDLVATRRDLSLFQHYNALSGTALEHVMQFYAEKLFDGFIKTDRVLEKCVDILTHITKLDPNYNLGYAFELPLRYTPTIYRKSPFSLPRQNVLIIPELDNYERPCTVYNPVLHRRTQLITLHVTSLDVAPFDLDNKPLPFEILPVFRDMEKGFPEILRDVYQLNVLLSLEPLSLKTFKIRRVTGLLQEKPSIYQNNIPKTYSVAGFRVMQLKRSSWPLKISNDYLKVYFDTTSGLATSVEVKPNRKSYRFFVDFLKYDVKLSKIGTQYSFESRGPAKPLNEPPSSIVLVRGKLQSYLEVHFSNKISQRVTLYNFGDGDIDKYSLEVTNLVDIRNENSMELIMRLKTRISSGETFYTDLNGFQMIKRKRFYKENSSLAHHRKNYYPMSSSMFIEDDDLRITVLSKQPLGVSSLSSGEIEVMLDRRLNRDAPGEVNNRQLYGIQDNVLTRSTFKILFEKPTCRDTGKDKKPPMLSLASQLALQSMLHPPKVFGFLSDHRWNTGGLTDYSSSGPEVRSLPCDIQLVDMPMLPMQRSKVYAGTSQIGLLIHRVGFDGTFLNTFPLNGCIYDRDQLGQFNLSQWTGDLFEDEYQQMYLSFTKPKKGKPLHANSSLLLKPMEIYAFMVNFTSPTTTTTT